MTQIIPKPDGELSKEQKDVVSSLCEADLDAIDREFLLLATQQWQKVVRIVANIMLECPPLAYELPDIFYAKRLYKLVEMGILDSRGVIGYMGFCEVRVRGNDMNRGQA